MPFDVIFDNLSGILGHFFEIDRLSNAFAAIIIVVVLGSVSGALRNYCLPLIWVGFDAVFGNIGKRLDRQNRAPRDLTLRGIIITTCAVITAMGIGSYLSDLTRFNLIAEIAALALCLSGGSVLHAQYRLYKALDKKQTLQGSYLTIARSSRNDLNSSDDFGITRIGMGLTAHCFSKAMVAPVFWYFVAGLTGAYLYAMIAMMAWRFGKEGTTKGFGRMALFLDHLFGYLPDIIAGFLISVAGLFTPTGAMSRALFGQIFGKERAPYAQGGKAMTALAYALKVNLGGPSVDMDGIKIARQWIGPEGGTAQLTAGHLRRAMYIGFVAHILFLAMIISIILWANIFS